MQTNTKLWRCKESAIIALVDQSKEEKRDLYLKKCKYGDNGLEYAVIPESEVLDYTQDNYIGRYLWMFKKWEHFKSEDVVPVDPVYQNKKTQIVVPEIDVMIPGFCE